MLPIVAFSGCVCWNVLKLVKAAGPFWNWMFTG